MFHQCRQCPFSPRTQKSWWNWSIVNVFRDDPRKEDLTTAFPKCSKLDQIFVFQWKVAATRQSRKNNPFEMYRQGAPTPDPRRRDLNKNLSLEEFSGTLFFIKTSYKLLVLLNVWVFLLLLYKTFEIYLKHFMIPGLQNNKVYLFFCFSIKNTHDTSTNNTTEQNMKNITHWTTRRPCQTLWCFTGCRMSM